MKHMQAIGFARTHLDAVTGFNRSQVADLFACKRPVTNYAKQGGTEVFPLVLRAFAGRFCSPSYLRIAAFYAIMVAGFFLSAGVGIEQAAP